MKCSLSDRTGKRRWQVALLGVVSVVLVACGGGGAGQAQGAAASCGPLSEPQDVKLGVNPGAQDLVTFVMQEQGFAEKHNLQLEVSSFQNPAALQEFIASQPPLLNELMAVLSAPI